MHSLTFVSVVVCVVRKPRPCPSYSRRRDRVNLVLLRSFFGGGGGYLGALPRCFCAPERQCAAKSGGTQRSVTPSFPLCLAVAYYSRSPTDYSTGMVAWITLPVLSSSCTPRARGRRGSRRRNIRVLMWVGNDSGYWQITPGLSETVAS